MAARAAQPPAQPRLAHRGVVVVDPGLLPALVPDGWREAGEARGQRLVEAGGQEEGTRPFLLAPALDPRAAAEALAAEGAQALVLVADCRSPHRLLEPGDLLVAERVRTPEAEVAAHPALANKLWNRAERRGLRPRRGALAGEGRAAGADELAEADGLAAFLAEAARARVPAGALLVCSGLDDGTTEAPGAVLEAFDRVFGVVQEVLGAARRLPGEP